MLDESKGNYWDKAVVERFFSSVNCVWIQDNLYRTRFETIQDGKNNSFIIFIGSDLACFNGG